MSESGGLRISTSAAVKERRLLGLLGERPREDPELRRCVLDAQLLGSLELAGYSFAWEDVERTHASPEPVARLRAAQSAVAAQAPFSVDALLAWHREVTGEASGLRRHDRARDGGPPPAPGAFVASRLGILEQWLGVESAQGLKPSQQGALVMARILEILPFDDANGRTSRLAASHLMVRAGARPPILVRGDRVRLEQALQAAFQLATEPLASLLEEASERALDVMIQALERRAKP